MRIVMLAAGAGGMYCGRCLRDNALAAAIMRRDGDDELLLVPLYTPLRTDDPDVSTGEIFYGGVNVYLQQASRLFRHTPRAVDWLFDRRRLLTAAGKLTGSQAPAELGELTVSILAGENGRQRKELDRLLDHLAAAATPEVVILPNAMFLGLAEPIRRRTGARVICELTGEDAFLAALDEPHRSEAEALIRAGAAHVDRFIATCSHYAAIMAMYMQVARDRIDVVLGGISGEGLTPLQQRPPDRPPTIAYLSRLCPEKGLDALIEATALLRERPGMGQARLVVGGFLPRSGPDRTWFEQLPADGFEYVGEVDLPGKLALLQSADVLCVPTIHPEAKGLYVLEGWACGLPFVGFDHGALSELLDVASEAGTRPGRLAPNGDTNALADALEAILTDEPTRQAMARVGLEAVAERFSADRMAGDVLAIVHAVRAGH